MSTTHKNDRIPIRHSIPNRKRKPRRLRSRLKRDRKNIRHYYFLQQQENRRLKLQQTNKCSWGRRKTHEEQRTGLVPLCAETSTHKNKEINILLFYSHNIAGLSNQSREEAINLKKTRSQSPVYRKLGQVPRRMAVNLRICTTASYPSFRGIRSRKPRRVETNVVSVSSSFH